MVISYFFDTYAFYELIEGNENYRQYTSNVVIFTTQMNLMELHYGLLVKYGKETADRLYDKLRKFAVDVSDDIVKAANAFRKVHSKRKLSYVDCVGYMIAKSLAVPFLTGDRQFVDLDNVRFVK